ncbi:hypothetical protein GGR57DRAFT_112401 [Xylariaceae sp. FL1272]|nr:hypothetical protein GGR57DRAFT_112401 [Xylariaceae sp. FL1272]
MVGLRNTVDRLEPLDLATEIWTTVKNSTQVVAVSDFLHYTFHTTNGSHHATMSSASDPKVEKAETAEDKTDSSSSSDSVSEIQAEDEADASTDVPPPSMKTSMWNAMRFPWKIQAQADVSKPADDGKLEDVDLESSRKSHDSEPEYDFPCSGPDRAGKKKRSQEARTKKSRNDSDSEDDEWVVVKANAKAVDSKYNKPETRTSWSKEAESKQVQSKDARLKDSKSEKQTTNTIITSSKHAGASEKAEPNGSSLSDAAPSATGNSYYADSKVVFDLPYYSEHHHTSSGSTVPKKLSAYDNAQLVASVQRQNAIDDRCRAIANKSHPETTVEHVEHANSSSERSEYEPKVANREFERFPNPEQLSKFKEEPKPKELPTSATIFPKPEKKLEPKEQPKTKVSQYRFLPVSKPQDPIMTCPPVEHSNLRSMPTQHKAMHYMSPSSCTSPQADVENSYTQQDFDAYVDAMRFGENVQQRKTTRSARMVADYARAELAEKRAEFERREKEDAEKRKRWAETEQAQKKHTREIMNKNSDPYDALFIKHMQAQCQPLVNSDKDQQLVNINGVLHYPLGTTTREEAMAEARWDMRRLAAQERTRQQALDDVKVRQRALAEEMEEHERARVEEMNARELARVDAVKAKIDQLKAEGMKRKAEQEKEKAEAADAMKRADGRPGPESVEYHYRYYTELWHDLDAYRN